MDLSNNYNNYFYVTVPTKDNLNIFFNLVECMYLNAMNIIHVYIDYSMTFECLIFQKSNFQTIADKEQ